ncbi:MAG: fatty acyl-AMP ligase [Deltaproteobacteria bacterium]|nr:fatty acyl-AMP ligase [Deltaproteobacteria bacterium]NCP03768.1 fatty acyl-AMP ligase [Deltaproteobacteria bacterium]
MDELNATPTENTLSLRLGDFSTLAEALDYAAAGQTGFNFYSGRGELACVLSYTLLRTQARILAGKLLSLGLPRGSHFALIAETDAEFVRFFFACQYAGLVPVPLPAALHLGGHQAIVEKMRGLLAACGASAAMATLPFFDFLSEAAGRLQITHVGCPDDFDRLPESAAILCPLGPTETAYLQYTSGSTRFPRGVVINQQTVMANLAGITEHGLCVRPGDRCTSWLPFYHDMGLVGFLLAPLVSQLSVDYLNTRDFAVRPRLWPALISRNRSTISYSPTFGYALCARRMRPADIAQYDLSSWRIAGTGAEPIRPDVLEGFAEVFAAAGFRSQAFVASYGMAECSLAISFAPLNRGLELDRIKSEDLVEKALAVSALSDSTDPNIKDMVFCGRVLPGHELEVRDGQGRALPERHCGVLFVRGPSVMSGYLNDPQATAEVLSCDGWLNTGDLGYLVDGQVVVTGRQKDLIIINGRNIWPQDLEVLAEELPGIRLRDAAAFSVPGVEGEETVVLVVQFRYSGETERILLIDSLRRRVREEFGFDCFVELVPPRTLPQTSSGKLSRTAARKSFLERQHQAPNFPLLLQQTGS